MVASLQLHREAIADVIRESKKRIQMYIMGSPRFILVEGSREIDLDILGVSPVDSSRVLILGRNKSGRRFICRKLTPREISDCSHVVIFVKGKPSQGKVRNNGVAYNHVQLLRVTDSRLTRISEKKETAVKLKRTGRASFPFSNTITG